MLKLNQVIALVAGRKTRTQKLLTDMHQGWKKDRLKGISRSYEPIADDGEKLAPEYQHVQLVAGAAIEELVPELTNFYDLVATQETANTTACATIKIDGHVIAADVPVCILLFLERQIVDLLTMAKNLPILPDDRIWTWDEAKACSVTSPEQTLKTQKKIEVIVKYEATTEHPAQTEVVQVDRTVGRWTTIHLSGALSRDRQREIVANLLALQEAVKCAREEANSASAGSVHLGKSLFDFVFSTSK